jgi:hypothetical protein
VAPLGSECALPSLICVPRSCSDIWCNSAALVQSFFNALSPSLPVSYPIISLPCRDCSSQMPWVYTLSNAAVLRIPVSKSSEALDSGSGLDQDGRSVTHPGRSWHK